MWLGLPDDEIILQSADCSQDSPAQRLNSISQQNREETASVQQLAKTDHSAGNSQTRPHTLSCVARTFEYALALLEGSPILPDETRKERSETSTKREPSTRLPTTRDWQENEAIGLAQDHSQDFHPAAVEYFFPQWTAWPNLRVDPARKSIQQPSTFLSPPKSRDLRVWLIFLQGLCRIRFVQQIQLHSSRQPHLVKSSASFGMPKKHLNEDSAVINDSPGIQFLDCSLF